MRLRGQHGYAMAALLVALNVMAVMLTVALPVWKTAAQREKEAELIFRGQQYVRAIELYQRKFPGAAPLNLDVLLDQKFLRKKYKDPITGEDFALLSPNSPGVGLGGAPQQQQGGRGGAGASASPGRSSAPAPVTQQAPGAGRGGAPGQVTVGLQAGISGVVSTSKASSIRIYNGRTHYNEWQFVHVPRAPAPGTVAPGVQPPGVPGQRGLPGPVQPGIGPTGRGGADGRGGPPSLPPGGRSPFPPGQPGGRGGPGVQPVFPR